jgi:hypothetical protein
LGLQPVVWFIFLGIKRQGRKFRHLPPHKAGNQRPRWVGLHFYSPHVSESIRRTLLLFLNCTCCLLTKLHQPCSIVCWKITRCLCAYICKLLQISVTWLFVFEFRNVSAELCDFLSVLIRIAAPVKSDEK